MTDLSEWYEFLKKDDLDFQQVDALEYSPSIGNAYVLGLFFMKIKENLYELSIWKHVILGSTIDIPREEDEDGNMMPPEEIDGVDVWGRQGDWWVGDDIESHPDPENLNAITFSDISDPKIEIWLKSNGWVELQDITPGQMTFRNY